MGKWITLGCLGVAVLALIVGGLVLVGTYNDLVSLDQGVRAQGGVCVSRVGQALSRPVGHGVRVRGR